MTEPRKPKKSELTRERIIAAAAKVVALNGYPKTSISRITSEAGISSGAFYYYYTSREELLADLLPALGKDLIGFIQARVSHIAWGPLRELAGFDAYFDFLEQCPEFYRVFTEAQVYVPEAYKRHLYWIIRNFVRNLRDQKRHGGLRASMKDLTALAFMLAGIRNYATQMLNDTPTSRKDTLLQMRRLYRLLLTDGLYGK